MSLIRMAAMAALTSCLLCSGCLPLSDRHTSGPEPVYASGEIFIAAGADSKLAAAASPTSGLLMLDEEDLFDFPEESTPITADVAASNNHEALPEPTAVEAAAAILAGLPLGIIGETEAVYLPEFSIPFEARIDTGATTSSMDARNITHFERDGKHWVRFEIHARPSGEIRSLELPVVRTVQIKRHGAEPVTRPSVILTFRMGHMTLQREFTLTDRSGFAYPVLIGRNVINGLAAVDPSRQNML